MNYNSNLYDNGWLDVVFNNRNKSYGAYALRQQSSSIVLKALGIAVPVFVLFFLAPAMYTKLFPSPISDHIVQVEMVISDPVHTLEPKEPEKIPEKELPKAAPLKQQVKTTAFSGKIVVVDREVPDPPSAASLEQTVIGSITQEGITGIANAGSPEGMNGGTGNAGNGAVDGDNNIYMAGGVEVYPEFPGGMTAWAKFIQRNLRYPDAAQENQVQGKVYISFVVEKDGSITDVTVMRGIGYGCDEEALRVIKKSPRWKPGMQNNKPVRVKYNIPIGYVMP